MSGSDIQKTKKIKLFGLDFLAMRVEEAACEIVVTAQKDRKKIVVTPNVDQIVTIKKNSALFRIWQNSDFIFADGMPIVWLSRFVRGGGLPERVTGADMMPLVCGEAAKVGLKVMILGGGEGVAEKAKKNLEDRYPALDIIRTICPAHGFEKDLLKTDKIIAEINVIDPDILFFCVGAPKSEKWLSDNLETLQFGVALCVGAAVDFAAGNIVRAPIFIQNIGFEWFWRFCQEPGRLWKRYLIKDTVFFYYALIEIIKSYLTKSNEI